MATNERESESSKRERSGVLTVAVVVLLVLPVVYLFATGPITWLADRNYLSEQASAIIYVIYWPLIYLDDNSPLFHRLFELWCNTWGK
jgi:hypothetical protein